MDRMGWHHSLMAVALLLLGISSPYTGTMENFIMDSVFTMSRGVDVEVLVTTEDSTVN